MAGNRNGAPRRHGVRYPWVAWFGRAEFTLRRGRDFASLPHGMAMTVRQAARRHGLDVSVAVGEASVTVRVKA